MSLERKASELRIPPSKARMTKEAVINYYESMLMNKFYDKLAVGYIKKPTAPSLLAPEDSLKKEGVFTEPKIKSTHDVLVLTNGKLPNLRLRQNQSFQQKIVVNETLYVHERFPIKSQQSIHSKKKLSMQRFPSKVENISFPKFVSKSSKKVNDLQIIEVEEKQALKQFQIGELFTPRKQLKRHKSIDKIKKDDSQIYQYPVEQDMKELLRKYENSEFQKPDMKEFFKERSKIEKLLDHYKGLRSGKKKDSTEESIEQMKKIKVLGQKTIYCEKKEPAKKKQRVIITNQSLKVSVNWKIRDVPITGVTKCEINKLFAFYLFTREIVTAPSGHYKFYVGEGNNGHLIARILKSRGWWVPTEDINQAHLIWTQLPQEEQISKVSSHQEIQLISNAKSYLLMGSDEQIQNKNIAHFLKFKSNPFFKTCQKMLHPLVYHKVMIEMINKFRENVSIKPYGLLKDAIQRYYPKVQTQKIQSKNMVLINHCENSHQIGDKKQLFYHLQRYCQIKGIDKHAMIPTTVHLSEKDIQQIKSNNTNEQIYSYLNDLQAEQRLYILKPGESSNRGNGITVHQNKLALVNHISSSLITFPENKTYIVQEYIDPLLYDGRKFDIRVWALYSNNKIWFYREGYVRTSCKEYTTKNMNKFVHLTNDAVQKYCEEYGKYQPANKISFNQLDKYLKREYKYDQFYPQTYESIKRMTKELFQAGSLMIGKSSHQFQLFGLDFLIDSNFKAWLIQCNTNPSIEICCSLLNRLVPNMIENVLNIVADPLFPQVERKAIKDDSDWNPQRFNFQLLHDADIETDYLEKIINFDEKYLAQLKEINPYKLERINQAEQSLLSA